MRGIKEEGSRGNEGQAREMKLGEMSRNYGKGSGGTLE